jgi:hypothetical protein
VTDERLPYFGAPPPRVPRRADSEPALRGKRLILSLPYGFVYDVRAASEIYREHDGARVLDVVSEEDYFAWMFTGREPSRQIYPVHLVWVE